MVRPIDAFCDVGDIHPKGGVKWIMQSCLSLEQFLDFSWRGSISRNTQTNSDERSYGLASQLERRYLGGSINLGYALSCCWGVH